MPLTSSKESSLYKHQSPRDGSESYFILRFALLSRAELPQNYPATCSLKQAAPKPDRWNSADDTGATRFISFKRTAIVAGAAATIDVCGGTSRLLLRPEFFDDVVARNVMGGEAKEQRAVKSRPARKQESYYHCTP